MVGEVLGEGNAKQGKQQELETKAEVETEEGEWTIGADASLLQCFEQIHQGYKELVSEVQTLRSRFEAEAKRREALEVGYDSLKQDNERLKKLYTEKLINFVHQFECHSKCRTLKEELNEAGRKLANTTAEHEKAIEELEQQHQTKIADLDKQISCLVFQKSANEVTISQLQQELAAQEKKVGALNKHLGRVAADTELQYQREIQELRDWIMVEQEEKKELLRKLQSAETELLITKTKQSEQLRESISNRHVETLKQKVMKLRKENETLKRQLATSESADI